ncbi:MAG: murein biosynthesis integral membrane protein MurJ [Pseudomonadota bacterium]
MRRLLKNTVMISFLTLGSRILGVIRDALIAMVFGTSFQSDAFFIAFRPFDLVRKLFSEGILSISFVPVFSRTLEKEGKSKTIAMVFSFLCFLSVIGTTIVLAGFVFAPFMIKIIAPGFVENPVASGLTIYLFKIMLPYLWCIFIIALCMGVLNTLGNFGTPAVAPVLFNIVVIIFTLFSYNLFDIPVAGLALGVTIGGIVQLLIQIPFMIRLGMFNPQFFKVFHPDVLAVFKIMLPCMIGAASYQINIMVASFFASKLDEGSVSYMYYADRLVQFPLALFAVSVATVFLPELSRRASLGNLDTIAPLFSKGVKLVFFITIPAMAGLMVLNEQIVAFLFGHGKFDVLAVKQTSDCLFFLVTGLWAFTGVRIFVTLYYALSSIKVPFYCGLVSMALNLFFCYFSSGYFGLKGLVLSVSLSSIVGFVLLFINIPGKVNIDRFSILVSACRSLFLSVIMFFIIKLAMPFLFNLSNDKLSLGAGLATAVSLGVVVYLGLNLFISTPEFKLLKQGIIEKINDKT